MIYYPRKGCVMCHMTSLNFWKIETPGRPKVGFISLTMHQNSPFEFKNRQNGMRGYPLPTPYPLGASILASTALDLEAYGASVLCASIRPPSHTFWIRPGQIYNVLMQYAAMYQLNTVRNTARTCQTIKQEHWRNIVIIHQKTKTKEVVNIHVVSDS